MKVKIEQDEFYFYHVLKDQNATFYDFIVDVPEEIIEKSQLCLQLIDEVSKYLSPLAKQARIDRENKL